jgi:single-stranded DNA-binding protein
MLKIEATGNIGKKPELKHSQQGNGRPYYLFSLAQSQGSDEKKQTNWFTVRAFIDELSGDLLDKGMRVTVKGKLFINPYKRGDGSDAIEYTILGDEVRIEPRREQASQPE